MGIFNRVVNVATLGAVPDITGEDAAAAAAAASNAGSEAAIAENQRQFDLTRADLLPFLEAATGAGGQGGGALDKFMAGLNQSPQAPELQQFSFDPNSVLDNPNFQFLREQGNIAADRSAAKNRQLGSGNRLLAAQEFGQGLSTNFLNSEFNQQRTLTNDNNNRLLQQHSLGLQAFNDRLNRLGGLIDTGRGTGSNLGQIGANSAATIGALRQNIGDTNGAAIIAGNNGINNLVNTGITAAGYALGGPAGGAAASRLSPVNSASGYSPIDIGFNPSSQNFFG